jgi:xanthine dehydrogenase YagT iron-sulfur-binding subunit
MPENRSLLSVTRRAFLKGLGTTAVASATAGARTLADELQKHDPEQVYGPGPVPLQLQVNGASVPLELPPSTTLLEALREHLPLTGAKEACGKGTCGACTVHLDGRPVNACLTLAIEAQGHAVTTVEGLAPEGTLTPLQQALVEADGLQCGYCTPGFVMSLTALLAANPHPNEAEVRHACTGHLCRCGSYPRVFDAALRAAGAPLPSHTEVIEAPHGPQLA